MKKFSKVISILLATVMLLGILSGCNLFGRDTSKYRQQPAVKISDNTAISIGKILDSFNNAYYQYYYYIVYYGWSINDLFDMVMDSLLSRYMQIDAYVADSASAKTTHSNAFYKDIERSEFLTEKEMAYCTKYIKYSVYSMFDSYVQTYAEADGYTFTEEEESTSRDFAEADEFGVDVNGDPITDYVGYVYNQNFDSDEMDEYMNKFYPSENGANGDISGYVYANASDASAKLADLNGKKAEENAEITFDQYKKWQEKAVDAYKKSSKKSYGVELDSFVVDQIADLVDSVIVAKYNRNLNKEVYDLVSSPASLKEKYQMLQNEAKTSYNTKEDQFVTDIEGLGSTSFIYNVPSKFDVTSSEGGLGNGYIFVKNLLVPFNDAQKQYLTNLGKVLGSTTCDEYLEAREKLAAEIVATNFSDNSEVENLFKYNEGTKKVEINSTGALSSLLSTVSASDFVELMKKYNTDTAQHTATYEYVVRVGDVPADYSAKWVSEFVTAGNDAYKLGIGRSSICVSSYGVHIVYYSGNVKADINPETDFTVANVQDTSSTVYRFFKAYFTDRLSYAQTVDAKNLKSTYCETIKELSVFGKFMEENGIEYDMAACLAE